MSENVGPINISDPGARFLSPAFRRGEDVSPETEVAIDREVKAILLEGQDKARAILTAHRDDLDSLATVLLDRESLDRKELDGYFGGDGAVPPAADDETQELTEPTLQS